MKQAPLHRVLKEMLRKDTGTNVHTIRVYRTSLDSIRQQLRIVDRDNIPPRKGRKFEIKDMGDGEFTIQIYRPIIEPKTRFIL